MNARTTAASVAPAAKIFVLLSSVLLLMVALLIARAHAAPASGSSAVVHSSRGGSSTTSTSSSSREEGQAGDMDRKPAPGGGRNHKPDVVAGEEAGHQGWLGVFLQAIPPLSRSALGLGDDQGMIVENTVRGSAAEKAGLRRGDVLLRVNGSPIASEVDVREALKGEAGREVRLDILRSAKPMALSVTAGDRAQVNEEMPGPPEMGGGPGPEDEDSGEQEGDSRDMTIIVAGGAWLGVEPQNLGRELGESFGVPSGKGVLLARVLPNSPAEKAGLKAGDVLTRFDGKPLVSESELRKSLAAIRGKKTVELTVVRKGETKHFTVSLASQPNWRSQFSLPDLRQWHWNFREEDRSRLQAEVHRLRQELDRLQAEIRDMASHSRDRRD